MVYFSRTSQRTSSISIAVLITCHNRQEKTLNCLAALFNQSLSSEIILCVYLVDDGSTDGTAKAVQQCYPQVRVLQGSGNLFWVGGMRQAFDEAIRHEHDYHFWLNDDTLLYAQALNTLLATSNQLVDQGHKRAIVAGSTQDLDTGKLTYGGKVRSRWWHPLAFGLVEPSETVQRCAVINGNCVLIPRSVFEVVGNLDHSFTHYIGDFDYALRAQQNGCTVWLAPGFAGTCSENPIYRNEKCIDKPISEQLQKIQQPKGLATKDVILTPFKEWRVFTKRHGGWLWFFYYLLPYRRLIWLSTVDHLRGLTHFNSKQA